MAIKKKSIGKSLSLGSMSASLVLKNLPFVLFLAFLTIIYISNTHLAEKQIREIQSLQKEVKELKRHYNSLKSEIMLNSRLAEVEGEAKALGLRKKRGSVKRIILED